MRSFRGLAGGYAGAIVLSVLFTSLATPVAAAGAGREPEELIARYMAEWKSFHPSRAVREGFLDSVVDFEDRSAAAVDEWIGYNEKTLARLGAFRDTGELSRDEEIDLRLLRAQIRAELDRWQTDRPHERSLALYADRIANAVAPILDSTRLSQGEKHRYLLERLTGIEALAAAARANLVDGAPEATATALESLEAAAASIANELPHGLDRQLDAAEAEAFFAACERAAAAITELVAWVRSELEPRLSLPDAPILGRERYAEKLAIYTDSNLTPEELEAKALAEMEETKRAIEELSARYWAEVYPDEAAPADFDTLVGRAFRDLENHRPELEQPYLEELRRYGAEVEAFVRDHEIATVPEHNTLSIELAPESSGPMARIGFVSSAPAFHPNPWTTWYLATIPDSHPEQERIDFWRSFNYPFKKFTVLHELFPGHYMQLKVLRENAHPVRILFPYRPFIEGWATFCEKVALDAGYAEGDWLTRLAQLRKRLENANRAYMSVQAHVNGWSEQQVFDYSVEESLLAPQFAKSLWGRLMRWPMQIITYMLVGLELTELWEEEKLRQGEAFNTKVFMDTILRTGPVPTEELAAIVRAEMPGGVPSPVSRAVQ